MKRLFQLMSDSIRCGQHSITNIKSQERCLHQAVLVLWATDLVRAIGAKVGCKDKAVINIAGDGCFRMNMNEVATATRYNIPVIEIVFSTTTYSVWYASGRIYSTESAIRQLFWMISVDFVKVSEGMGAKGVPCPD